MIVLFALWRQPDSQPLSLRARYRILAFVQILHRRPLTANLHKIPFHPNFGSPQENWHWLEVVRSEIEATKLRAHKNLTYLYFGLM